jgi:serine/threonine-protein kinase RsbW
MAKIISENIGKNGRIVKIIPQGLPHDISLVPSILAEFNTFFEKRYRYYVVDLADIGELSPSFIASLFEITAKARRIGGDVEIVNMAPSVAVDIENFRCPDYLSFGQNEEKVFAEYLQDTENEIPEKAISKEINNVTFQIPSRVDEIYKISDQIIKIADEMGFDQGELSKIKIAVYEGCLNAIEHAYHSDPNFSVKVYVEYTGEKLEISVLDFGEGFKDGDNGSFDVIKAAMDRTRGGMGLHIIKRSMDEVSYENDTLNGNKLILTKYLKSASLKQ